MLASALLIAWVAFGSLRHDRSTDKVLRINLGFETDSPAAVERMALRDIGDALTRYPNAQVIGARWSESPLFYLHLDEEYDRRGIVYERDKHCLWFYSGGGEGAWEGVSPSMITRSVIAPSPFMAFKAFGCKSWP